MRADPARRAGRSDRFRKLWRQVADELHGADDRVDTVAERADRPFFLPLVEFRRKPRTDPRFDCVDELLAAEAGIMLEGLFDGVPVSEVGEQLGELAVALELALEQHAVEVEYDRAQARHQSSNNAVPTRTAVAPSITASL